MEISSAGYAPGPYSASHMSTAKQCIPKLSAVSNTRAQLLQKWQDSLACIVWSCNGRAVNLKNPPIFATLVKMTSPAMEVEECGSGNFQSVSVHGCWPEIRVSRRTATSD